MLWKAMQMASAEKAKFNNPSSIVAHGDQLYICDQGNGRIRVVNVASLFCHTSQIPKHDEEKENEEECAVRHICKVEVKDVSLISEDEGVLKLRQNKILVISSITQDEGNFSGHMREISRTYRNTVFVCDTRNKRMLTSAKKLVPLQKEMAKYANVFKLDRKASSKDLPTTFDEHLKHVQEVNDFFSEQEQKAFERTGKLNTNRLDMTVAQCTRQSFQIVLDLLTCLSNTLTEIGKENLLDRICFESLTTLSVGCFFKAIRADHDMPTVAGYAYKRARCVKDDMMRIYQKSFSYFTRPNSFCPEKIINSDPPDMESRVTKQSVASKGSGDKTRTNGTRT